jgi:hypothetical protein
MAREKTWYESQYPPEPAKPAWLENYITLHSLTCAWSGVTESWIVIPSDSQRRFHSLVVVRFGKTTMEQFLRAITDRGGTWRP